MKDNHGDPVLCKECNSDAVEPVPIEGHADSQFAFVVTRRKDGSVVDPPFLGTIQLVHCTSCDHEFASIDSAKSPEHWASLPKWEEAH